MGAGTPKSRAIASAKDELRGTQLMKLNTYQPGVSLSPYLQAQNWASKPESPSATWVKLQVELSAYSHDEALLLCQHSDTEWMAWVPDYGEVILHRSQFTEC